MVKAADVKRKLRLEESINISAGPVVYLIT
jgi:hypothetical protein